MKCLMVVLGVLLLAGFAFSADIDGKWSGTITGMDMTVNFTFKADGKTLSGVHSVNGQDTAFKDGKIDGNTIAFTVNLDMGGQPMKIEHKGVLSGDQIKMTYDMMGQPGEIILKRVK
jgi:hypothetical protein